MSAHLQHTFTASSTPALLLLFTCHMQEPAFFTRSGNCSHPGSAVQWSCDKGAMRHYIENELRRDAGVAAGLSKASFESSTAYVWVRCFG